MQREIQFDAALEQSLLFCKASTDFSILPLLAQAGPNLKAIADAMDLGYVTFFKASKGLFLTKTCIGIAAIMFQKSPIPSTPLA